MTIVLILAGIFALIGFVAGLDEGLLEGFGGLIGGAALGAGCGFLLALAIGAFVYNGTHWEVTKRTPLVSLADGSDIHGNFFLGSGMVNSEPSFTWYESDGNNSYVREDVEASLSTVHYLPSGVPPYYTVTEKKKDGSFVRAWGFDTADPYEQNYDFYIPRGSIVQSYRLDNK